MSIPYRTPLTLTQDISTDFYRGATVVALYKGYDKNGRLRYRCCLPYSDINVVPMRIDRWDTDLSAYQTRTWVYPEYLRAPSGVLLLCQCGNDNEAHFHHTDDGVKECHICGTISVGGRLIPNEIKSKPKKKPMPASAWLRAMEEMVVSSGRTEPEPAPAHV